MIKVRSSFLKYFEVHFITAEALSLADSPPRSSVGNYGTNAAEASTVTNVVACRVTKWDTRGEDSGDFGVEGCHPRLAQVTSLYPV